MMMDLGSYGQLQPKKILSVSLIESERLCRKWHGAADGRALIARVIGEAHAAFLAKAPEERRDSLTWPPRR